MVIKYLCLVVSFVAANVIWGDPQQRPNLDGTWRLEPTQSVLHSHALTELTWQIEQSDNTIHLIQRLGGRKNVDEFRCGTDGKDCKIKDEGHTAVISLYYNGRVLIELESQGQNRDTVTKKRLYVSEDGSLLTVELIHVLPQGKPPEKLILSRQPKSDH